MRREARDFQGSATIHCVSVDAPTRPLLGQLPRVFGIQVAVVATSPGGVRQQSASLEPDPSRPCG